MTDSRLPQYAAHFNRIGLIHESTDAREQNGATTWWLDGTTSYVLHFRSGHNHAWSIADETDTVIQAVDSLREGEEISTDRLWHSLTATRRLRTRLAAIEAELILYARETGPDGKRRMPLREIADGLEIHHTTVAERHTRMEAGDHAAWRHWLVQDTPRDTMYQPGAARRVDATSWDRGQDPAAKLCAAPHADGATGCGRPSAHGAVPGDTGHQDHTGRRWPNAETTR